MEAKIFKTLLLLEIAAESFQTSPKISSQWSSQKYGTVLDFWNFEFPILTIFLRFLNMGPYGSILFKTLLLPQITIEYFETFPEFSSQ